MSKITFRADDDLVERLEGLNTSKSEAMREALRLYLDGTDRDGGAATGANDEDGGGSSADLASDVTVDDAPVDDIIRERVDELVDERLDERLDQRPAPVGRSSDLNLNISLDGVNGAETEETETTEVSRGSAEGRKTPARTGGASPGDEPGSKTCDKCGETVDGDHVYCPNCGEKASHRVFCECGDELRSDWAFCPGCGRRTSAADVLEHT